MSPNAVEGGNYGVSAYEYSYAQLHMEPKINFGDLPPYLTYARNLQNDVVCLG
jgi:hypothetical protein